MSNAATLAIEVGHLRLKGEGTRIAEDSDMLARTETEPLEPSFDESVSSRRSTIRALPPPPSRAPRQLVDDVELEFGEAEVDADELALFALADAIPPAPALPTFVT